MTTLEIILSMILWVIGGAFTEYKAFEPKKGDQRREGPSYEKFDNFAMFLAFIGWYVAIWVFVFAAWILISIFSKRWDLSDD